MHNACNWILIPSWYKYSCVAARTIGLGINFYRIMLCSTAHLVSQLCSDLRGKSPHQVCQVTCDLKDAGLCSNNAQCSQLCIMLVLVLALYAKAYRTMEWVRGSMEWVKGIMFLITMEIKYSLQVCFYKSTHMLLLSMSVPMGLATGS